MSEKSHPLPKAKIEKTFLNWAVWAVPVVAIGFCVYFIIHDVVFTGPTITIYFQNAEDLESNNSFIKYRGANIAELQGMELTPDKKHVAVKAKLYYFARDIARQGTVFWMVQPELKVGSIKGLRTIVSGNYIAVEPGEGERTNVFFALKEAPAAPVKAIEIVLLSDGLNSLQNQSPVLYRGIQVGEVLDCRLANDARHVIVRARIHDEYAPLVRVDSKFWNAGGINFHFGIFKGAEISAESAQTVLSGGIAFATPPEYGDAVTNGATFTLADKIEDEWKKWDPAITLRGVSNAIPEVPKAKSSLPQVNAK